MELCKLRKPRRRLWSVDVKEGTVTPLPEGREVRICLDPAQWDKGMIYIPPGAKIVPAPTAAAARQRVELLFENVKNATV